MVETNLANNITVKEVPFFSQLCYVIINDIFQLTVNLINFFIIYNNKFIPLHSNLLCCYDFIAWKQVWVLDGL